ncbi:MULTISPECIES: hypothetical protein [Paenibacillus]|nr:MULTISPECIES: hypothetical protein [Paenibacillus]QYK62223.1 hypothetical protein KAI37_02553 [Paenibacillus sp. S25]
MSRQAALLVFAPNLAGEQFLQALSEGEKYLLLWHPILINNNICMN